MAISSKIEEILYEITKNTGNISDAMKGADVFIGVSAPNVLTESDVAPVFVIITSYVNALGAVCTKLVTV